MFIAYTDQKFQNANENNDVSPRRYSFSQTSNHQQGICPGAVEITGIGEMDRTTANVVNRKGRCDINHRSQCVVRRRVMSCQHHSDPSSYLTQW